MVKKWDNIREDSKLNLRSNPIKEIIGGIPNRIIRYGISIIAIIISTIFILCFFFSYPDVIKGAFYIQTSDPPIFLLARSTGKIEKLLVNDKDTVSKGEILGMIENSVCFNSYLKLKCILDRDLRELVEKKYIIDDLSSEGLGTLHSGYAALQKALQEYMLINNIEVFNKKLNGYNNRIKKLKQHIELCKSQINLETEKLNIARLNFLRDSILFTKKIISTKEFEDSKETYINYKIGLTETNLVLSNNEMKLLEIQQDLLFLKQDRYTKKEELEIAINKERNNLAGIISDWEDRYLLISPINGVVSFSGIWKENQNVRTNQLVMTLVPDKQSQKLCKITIPINRSGKVKIKQKVNLKFSDFPYREFGIVIGKLDKISLVPDSNYIGTIMMKDSIVTNYGKGIPFKQNMQGVAEIITEDLSIAERILYPLKSFIHSYYKK